MQLAADHCQYFWPLRLILPERKRLWFIVGLVVGGASLAFGQGISPSQPGNSPLGVRQQRVGRMVEELEQKFKSLRLAIQDKEPERADRLQQALNKAKELLLEQRVADVTRLLDQSQFDSATDEQKAILANLRELAKVLRQEKSSAADAKERWNLLSQWKREIRGLTLAEAELKNASEQLAAQQSKAPPRSTFTDLSRKQQDLANQARRLSAQMRQAGDASWPSGEARPGQDNLASAQQAMQRAGGKLDNQNVAAAKTDQQQAINNLDAAQAEIDAALDEAREQAEQQSLADLEKLFREMLATQERLTKQTVLVEQKRLAAAGQLARTDRNAIRAIGDDERRLKPISTADGEKDAGLAGQAQLAAELVSAGSQATLASTVEALRDEFTALGNLLVDELRTDAIVTGKQQQTEGTLQKLIALIEQVKAQKRQAAADAQVNGGNKSAASGSSGKQSQQAAQGGKQGGGSKGIDSDATPPIENSLPQSPWAQLRDKGRDPVFSAVKEKFPTRYQQLIEQYYRSFSDERK